jgi:mRNA-degrading endonuclease RelE of RelBE toxin-antitoxin system
MDQGRFRSALARHFLREHKKLPANIRERVLLAIEEMVSSPFAGIRLRGELDGLLRWRIGD